MKKIIILVLVFLVMVSLVSGELGNELVTCGDFRTSCDLTETDNAWTCTASDGCGKWFTNNFDVINNYFYASYVGAPFENLNQTINIQTNKIYNVTINHTSCKTDGLIVELGGVNTSITETTDLANPITKSFSVTTLNTNQLELWAKGQAGCTAQRVLSISVKEIIPTPDTFLLRLQTATQTNEIIIELKEDTKFSVIAKAIKILWKIWIT